MKDLIRVVVGGSVAALAATLLFVNASRALDAIGREPTRAAAPADHAAPMLPRRARLVRLPDREDGSAAPEMHRVSWGQTAGLLALLGLSTLWLAGRRRLRLETT